jgi:hypothetical protein
VTSHLFLLLLTSLARAAEFPSAKLDALAADTGAQGAKTQAAFREARDKSCAEPTAGCAVALFRLAGEFDSLREKTAAFERFTKDWSAAGAASGLSDEEKRGLRHKYALAIKGVVVWVDGLGGLLDLSPSNVLMKPLFEAAALRLQKAVDAYGPAAMDFAETASEATKGFPVPSPPGR